MKELEASTTDKSLDPLMVFHPRKTWGNASACRCQVRHSTIGRSMVLRSAVDLQQMKSLYAFIMHVWTEGCVDASSAYGDWLGRMVMQKPGGLCHSGLP